MCAWQSSRPPRPATKPLIQSAHKLQSTLPASAFGTPDTGVEDALLASARLVFLRHMTGTVQSPAVEAEVTEPPPEPPPGDIVSADEIRACVDEVANLGPIEAPDLLAGLQHERVWILLHMARHGTGLSRQRATLELRTTLHKLSETPDAHRPLLTSLAQRLADVNNNASCAAIFQALLNEVRHALARCARESAPHP